MIIVNSDLETFISGTCGKENFSIPYTEEHYNALKDLESQAENAKTVQEMQGFVDQVKEVVDSYDFKKEVASNVGDLVYVPATGKYHIAVGKGYSNVHVPEKLTELIMDNYERNIESEPIINMCRRFILNPKPTQGRFNMLANYVTQTWTDPKEVERLMEEKGVAKEVAEKFATYSDLQITKEGYLKTSKVVEEITTKWALKLDEKGQPMKDESGNFIKEKVSRYTEKPKIDEETGEVTTEVEYPEFLEDRKFTPAIWKNGDQFTSGGVLGYKYEVGKLASLTWDQVDMTDGQAHERGLHTGEICPLAA